MPDVGWRNPDLAFDLGILVLLEQMSESHTQHRIQRDNEGICKADKQTLQEEKSSLQVKDLIQGASPRAG